MKDLHKFLISNGIIEDEIYSISYPRFRETLNRVEQSLQNLIEVRKIKCFNVNVRNDVSSVLLLLALFRTEITFIISSSYKVLSDDNINFYDYTIECVDSFFEGVDISESLSLSESEHYIGIPDDLLAGKYVFFLTSGTSGSPKLVQYSKDNLLANSRNCIDRFQYATNEKILITVPINHMFGFGAALLPAILNGLSCHLIDKCNVIKLYNDFREFKPSHTFVSPVLIKGLVKLDKDLPFRGIFVSAGEALKPSFIEEFVLRFGSLINLYGSTELGVIATTNLMNAFSNDDSLITMKNVQTRVELESGNQILYCQHFAAFDGYRDANGTILSSYSNDQWFFTKDFVEFLSSSQFKLIGRSDLSITRNGYLISIEALEAKIESLIPAINRVVLVYDDTIHSNQHYLVAVYELNKNMAITQDNLKKICKRHLQNYMIPDVFLYQEELEKLPSGKVNRKLISKNVKLNLNKYGT